jgi:hypothetical protein
VVQCGVHFVMVERVMEPLGLHALFLFTQDARQRVSKHCDGKMKEKAVSIRKRTCKLSRYDKASSNLWSRERNSILAAIPCRTSKPMVALDPNRERFANKHARKKENA